MDPLAAKSLESQGLIRKEGVGHWLARYGTTHDRGISVAKPTLNTH